MRFSSHKVTTAHLFGYAKVVRIANLKLCKFKYLNFGNRSVQRQPKSSSTSNAWYCHIKNKSHYNLKYNGESG